MVLARLRGWLGAARPDAAKENIEPVAAERVWGAGFARPGGAAEIARLIAPMRPAPGSPFLLVGATPTGAARAAAATGAVVTACEPAKNAAFGTACFARGLALEPLGGAPAAPILAALATAIMPVGQLTLVELATEQALDPGDAAVAAWLRLGQRAGPPPSAAQIGASLRQLGFALQSVQDQSEHHVAQARQDWNAAMARLDPDQLGEAERVVLEAEGARWRARLRLLASGQLRLICWHAVGKAPVGPAGWPGRLARQVGPAGWVDSHRRGP